MRILLPILLITGLAFTGCNNNNNDNPTPDNNNSQFFQDVTEHSGQLQINVTRRNGGQITNVVNAYVAIHLTYEDAQQEQTGTPDPRPLFWDFTAGDGFVDFGFVNRGNYYIYTEITNGNQVLSSQIDVVQVQSGRNTPIVKVVEHTF